MKAQFLIHNEAIANNVGVAIRNNWQSMKQQGEVLEVVIRPHKADKDKIKELEAKAKTLEERVCTCAAKDMPFGRCCKSD